MPAGHLRWESSVGNKENTCSCCCCAGQAEEEGALWSRPYVLKQWLLQAVGDAWELFQLLLSSRGTEGRGRPEGVGQWEVTSLFLLAPQDTGKDDADTQIRPTRVIACKGSPEDNPDWCKTGKR